MIQGFETREVTDKVIRAFVKSADGVLHKKSKQVDQYEQTEWITYNDFTSKPLAMFGILRGTGELITKCQDFKHPFYYFDHAYWPNDHKHKVNKIFKERIYRLTKNNFSLNYIDKLSGQDKERVEKFSKHIKMRDWNYDGKYILILPPSHHVEKYFGMVGWKDRVCEKLSFNTRRDLIVREKTDTSSFQEQLKDAFAVVSCQSTAAVNAIIMGVPSFCEPMSCAAPVSMGIKDLEEIEDPLYAGNRKEWLDSLLANQYTMTEIENGYAWKRVSR
jgi:hypothetical protein|tara:strand:- start:807 stop:1628 length:822 start_codon:yes stop_codon:yes gene_type:complete